MLTQQVLVFGAGGAGKSELLQALAGSRLPPGAVAAGEGLTALAQVERERDRAPTSGRCCILGLTSGVGCTRLLGDAGCISAKLHTRPSVEACVRRCQETFSDMAHSLDIGCDSNMSLYSQTVTTRGKGQIAYSG